MNVTECNIPSSSTVGNYLNGFNYWDSFEVCLTNFELEIHEIYLNIFAYMPWWVKKLILIRNKVVGMIGLKGPSAEELNNIECKSEYKLGENIGLFILYSLHRDEIVAGGDDVHMDFRVSVQRIREEECYKVVVTTVVNVNNIFGHFYLFIIKPFHRYGMKRLLENASIENRL